MNDKNLIEQEEKETSQGEAEFLVQSNIDEFIEEGSTIENDGGASKESSPISEQINDDEVQKNIDLQKKKLDEVDQSVSKQKTKKSKIINLVFFFVNLAVVGGILTYQLLNEDFVPISGLSLDVASLLMIVLLIVVIVLLESFLMSYLIKQSTGKWCFGTSFKVTHIGRYYDAVTPMATGGQPFQISYLKSRGHPIHTSLSIPLSKYLFGQIAWVLLSLACLIVSWTDKSFGTFVSITSLVGFILGFVVLAATIFLSVCKTVGKKLVVKILRLLYKMKIIKNYDKQYEKITKYISDYQDVMKQYAKSPKDFAVMTLTSILKLLVTYSIPFFIVKTFVPGLEGIQFFRLFVMTCLVDVASSFFPLPGGTGMNEISFTTAFAALGIQSDVLVWVLLLWRFCSYYFYLVLGVCILSYDMAYGNRKYRWQVRKNYLAEESAVFKQEQINRFRSARAKRKRSKI